MGTGTSVCNCMRTINRARIITHHGVPRRTACSEYSRHESLRTRRHVHAICRVASRPQSSRNLRTTTVAAAGAGSILSFHHTPSGWARPLPARIRNVRGLSTPTSSSQTVAADSDQQLENALHKVDPPKPQYYDAFVFETLRRRGQLELHIDINEGRPTRRKTCVATLEIPAIDRKFQARTRNMHSVSPFLFSYRQDRRAC